MATSKELRAKVKLDSRDAERKLKSLASLIKEIDRITRKSAGSGGYVQQAQRATAAAEKQRQAILKTQLAEEKLAQAKLRTAELEEKAASRVTSQAEKEQAKAEQAIQRELDRERVRQQSLKTLGEGDKAAQRIAATEEKIKRTEYEQWWQDELSLQSKIDQQKQSTKNSKVEDLIYNTQTKQTQQLNQQQTRLVRQQSTLDKVKSKVTSIGKGMEKWANAMDTALSKLRPTQTLFGSIWGFVKQIAGALIGIGTIKLAVQGADALTGAENRLNNIAANSLGESAYTHDSKGNVTGYSEKALQFTQDSMDKMYAAAKASRSSYSDMMNNVSKMMTLSADAFGGSIDNAIRFQEIMTKTYAIGGASAQEMSSSMYQLTQALGSGVLQGDELRSVREGAPLAYQAIEKFAQGVLKTSDSLKDLASDGKITSEMVVAAITNMGDEVDQQFAMTKWRFSEVWNSIKSSAERAFQPVVSLLTDALNKAVDNGLLEKVEEVFTYVAKAMMIAFRWVEKVFTWIADNWNTVKNAIVGGLIAIITYMTVLKTVSIGVAIVQAVAWATTHVMAFKCIATVVVLIAVLASVLYILYLWKTGAISTTKMIINCFLVIAAGAVLLGIILGSIPAILIGLVVLFVVLIIKLSQNLCQAIIDIAMAIVKGITYALILILGISLMTGAILVSWPVIIALAVVAVLAWLLAVFLKFTGEIVGTTYGLGAAIGAIWDNIGIWFNNMLANMKSGWFNFIASLCSEFEWLIDAINSVSEFFGKGTISISGLKNRAAEEEAKIKEYVDVGAAYNEAYGRGFEVGEGIQDKINGFGGKINEWGSKFQDEDAFKFDIDELGRKYGFLFNQGSENYDPYNDPAIYSPELIGTQPEDTFTFPNGTTNGNYDDVLDSLGNIDANTGAIADSMELADEDLEYLRKVADMEWKKEFTTATIQIDMKNNNTINGDADLEGIVTKLTDRLYEEMDAMANGVYAY